MIFSQTHVNPHSQTVLLKLPVRCVHATRCMILVRRQSQVNVFSSRKYSDSLQRATPGRWVFKARGLRKTKEGYKRLRKISTSVFLGFSTSRTIQQHVALRKGGPGNLLSIKGPPCGDLDKGGPVAYVHHGMCMCVVSMKKRKLIHVVFGTAFQPVAPSPM